MPDSQLTLRQAEVLLGFLRESSHRSTLKDVAAAMNLTAKGLAKQLDEAGKRLGIVVYEPIAGGRGFAATQPAIDLLPRLEQLHDAFAAVSDPNTGARPRTRITCFAGHVHRLWRAIPSLEEKFGTVEFRVVEEHRQAGSTGQADELLAWRADIVIGPSDLSWPLAVARSEEPVYRWRVVAVPPPGVELPDSATPRHLAGLPLLVSPSGHQSRRQLDEAASESAVPLRIEMESSSTTARWYMCRAGKGVLIAADDALYMRNREPLCELRRASRRSPLGGAYHLFWRASDARASEFAKMGAHLSAHAPSP